ncbi:TPA: LysR family transcriptional regulator [Burkholderia aenigmatica]|uniref:LysR substrate-binding domain-containing protein n=1 Tax=Burkholderia sp. AU45251 TaxID=3059204 RepID=UPI0026566510|nr:LysR substrate-binding domain-containing protein [Burkholderia sp. AU45251]HDR9482496.1 LysR family transcriptional regulator [Burkholderia aenigmatica]MDN7514864.1 LysR substrate-binding domain-containing protein [Burkholderia sp. AU45251]HDR9514802.1 LysR family transcriptional regulator [Burkholderia aenigmatica]HDR9590867.1 LysR family transcriptional regulator [Burkholderia aenigmatica]HDR9602793.1 LysR family transcriptional regulator [Burkholderia aenigmatica]
MDIRQLRYFVSIVEYGSLGKAAEKLYVAQPSLSQQIAKLEDDLGVALLVRSPQGVKPTAAGQALYRHAHLVLRQMEQLRQEVKEGAGSESGTVAVGFPTTMTSILAVPVFERVRARYPGIRLQYVESMSGFINELLANGRLDLAILFRESNTTGITALPLFDEMLCLLGEPGGAIASRSRTCSLAALAGVPLVAPGAPNGLRLLLERTFAREEVPLNIIADIDSLPTLLSLAQSGAACTILPASAVALRDPSGRPKMRRIVDPEIRRPASLCWSNTSPVNSAALAVRQTIVELVQELAVSGAWTGITLRAADASPA